MLGDVGEGRLAREGEVAGCILSPFMEAVRCEEAARAAAEGSRVELPFTDLFSGIAWGTWVGELLLGMDRRRSCFVENLRDRLLPIFSGGGCDTRGDIMSS